ncbi:MAG: hypothetical protein ABR912_14620 [Terracidiphilus sp.]|jgi:hypothetical protein
MKIHFVMALLVLFLGAALILGCKSKEVPRPLGLPPSAIWAGGEDGGSFIDCTPSRSGEPNDCTVYDERGDVYMKRGKYIVQGSNRGARSDELRYKYADGIHIGLEKGITLMPASLGNSGAPLSTSHQ